MRYCSSESKKIGKLQIMCCGQRWTYWVSFGCTRRKTTSTSHFTTGEFLEPAVQIFSPADSSTLFFLIHALLLHNLRRVLLVGYMSSAHTYLRRFNHRGWKGGKKIGKTRSSWKIFITLNALEQTTLSRYFSLFSIRYHTNITDWIYRKPLKV